MTKREKKNIINTLNKLNEEDESLPIVLVNVEDTPEHDLFLDHHKLRLCVDGVFKTVPVCEQPVSIDESKRVQVLEQVLVNHLVLNEINQPYQQITESSRDENTLSLNNLSLTNKILKDFNYENVKNKDTEDLTNFNYNQNKISVLNLKQNHFSQLPINLIDLFIANLESIDLSSNNFESLYLLQFKPLVKVKEINLSHNALKTIELTDSNESDTVKTSVNLLLTLERLNLSNNNLKSSSCYLLTQLKSLKYLNLSNNEFQINSMDVQLPWQRPNSQMQNLIELNLSCNNKAKISSKTAIRRGRLSLVNNQVGLFNNLISLKILDLSENNLHNIPPDIKDLRNLEQLFLDRNMLEFIPNEITELRCLKVLSLSSNRIGELSDLFCYYSKFLNTLVKLNLSKNQMKNETISYKIATYEELKYLDLSENLLELVPNPLPKDLEELVLNKNKIKSLMVRPLSATAKNDEELLQALGIGKEDKSKIKPNSKLKESDVYDEPDVDFAEQINLPHVFYLRKLKKLHLRDNHIQEVPTDFGILNSNLEFLDLGYNFLTQISVSLCRGLGGLKYLSVDSNRIRELPDKIRELSDLELLNLSKNRLLSLNYEVCNDLKNLKVLLLNNNNLEELPIFVPNRRPVSGMKRTPSSLSNASFVRKPKFTFNLPSLKKIDLSSNKFSSDFSFYSTFGLCSSLEEISLASNRIYLLDTDNDDESTLENLLNDESVIDEEKIKSLLNVKHKLLNLNSVNLSNNQIAFGKSGFIKLLVDLFKLAPNLKRIFYEQGNGCKLGNDMDLKKVVDDEFLFSLDEEYHEINETNKNSRLIKKFLFDLEKENYNVLINKLEVIDLSNNNLKKLPGFIYKLKNIKELYLNGNQLKKIPVEMYQETMPSDDKEFRELLKLQQLWEESKRRKKLEELEDEENEEEEVEEVEVKKKPKKKKPAPKKETENLKQEIEDVKNKDPANLISQKIQVLQLNNNKIEHVPENLFSSFASLKDIKLVGNPLKEPPQHSVCINSRLNRNNDMKRSQSMLSNRSSTVITLINNPKTKTTDDLERSLNSFAQANSESSSKDDGNKKNVFADMNDNLKPLQSFMLNHKKREGKLILLVLKVS